MCRFPSSLFISFRHETRKKEDAVNAFNFAFEYVQEEEDHRPVLKREEGKECSANACAHMFSMNLCCTLLGQKESFSSVTCLLFHLTQRFMSCLDTFLNAIITSDVCVVVATKQTEQSRDGERGKNKKPIYLIRSLLFLMISFPSYAFYLVCYFAEEPRVISRCFGKNKETTLVRLLDSLMVTQRLLSVFSAAVIRLTWVLNQARQHTGNRRRSNKIHSVVKNNPAA